MRFTHVVAPPIKYNFLRSRFRTLLLCMALCAVLVGMQGCKDPLEGDIPRKFDLLSNGDWQQVSGITGCSLNSIAASKSAIVIHTNGGLFRSVDNGISWSGFSRQSLNSEELIIPNYNMMTTKIVSADSTFLVSTGQKLFRSLDNGKTWEMVAFNYSLSINEICINKGVMFISAQLFGTSNFVILRSTDTAKTWQIVHHQSNVKIYSLAAIGDTIFGIAADERGVTRWTMRSINNGQSWELLSNLFPPGTVQLLAVKQTLFIRYNDGSAIMRSKNGGRDWLGVTYGTTDIYSMIATENEIFICDQNGIIFSNDQGETWSGIPSLWRQGILKITKYGSVLIAQNSQGLLRSVDGGLSWQTANTGITAAEISGIADANNTLLVSTSGGGVFRSQNNGVSWTVSDETFEDAKTITNIAAAGSTVFVGTKDKVFRSTNSGGSWSKTIIPNNVSSIQAIRAFGNRICIGTWNQILTSLDNGSSWQQSAVASNPAFSTRIVDFAFQNTNIYAASDREGVLRSNNNGTAFEQVSKDFRYFDPATKQTFVQAVAATDSAVCALLFGGGLYYSRNRGTSWSFVPNTSQILSLFSVNDSTFLAGTMTSGVLHSTNYGATWQPLNASNGDNPKNIIKLYLKGRSLFAGTQNNGLYRLPLR